MNLEGLVKQQRPDASVRDETLSKKNISGVMKMNLPHNHNRSVSESRIMNRIPDSEKFEVVADLLKTLSDSTRLQLFWILCHVEDCVVNLAAMLDVSSPAVSHHIRALKEYDLIESCKDGKEVYYKASDTEIAKLMHHTIEKVMQTACPVIDAKKCGSCDSTNDSGDISQIHDYLIDNIDKRITIDELSHRFLMNPTTLKSRFKETYGHSIASHIKEHRMEKASKLLLESDMPVAEISALVGYTSQSKFAASFAEAFGMLPLEYRKKCAHFNSHNL